MEVKLFEGERILVEMSRITRIITRKVSKSGKVKKGLKQTRKANRIIVTNRRLIEYYGSCCACCKKNWHITMLRDIKEVGYAYVPKKFCCCSCNFSIFSFKTDLQQTKFGIKNNQKKGRELISCLMEAINIAKTNESATRTVLMGNHDDKQVQVQEPVAPSIEEDPISTENLSAKTEAVPSTNDAKKPILKYILIAAGVLAAILLLVFGIKTITSRSNQEDPLPFEEAMTPSMELVGTIAGAPVHMFLALDGKSISGYYYYDKQRSKGNKSTLTLEGEIEDEDRYNFTEYSDGTITGVMDVVVSGSEWNGVYVRSKDSKEFPVNLRVVYDVFAEAEAAEPKEVEPEEVKPEERATSSIEKLFPIASERMYDLSEVLSLKKEEIRILRNAILARHGQIFDSDDHDLQEFFSQFDWYKPISSDILDQLTSIEEQNYAFLLDLETELDAAEEISDIQ